MNQDDIFMELVQLFNTPLDLTDVDEIITSLK